MSQLVRKPAALFSLAVVVILIPVALRLARVSATSFAAGPVVEVGPSTMIRAGLGADALAAIGVLPAQVAGILEAFEDAVAAEPTRLSSADAAYAGAKVESDRLRRLIESGRGDAGDVTAYQSEMQTLTTALADRASALDDFCAAAVDGLAGAQAQALARIHANRDWEIPVHFKVVDRSEADWVTLRKALADERICAKYGDEPDATLATFLATERAKPAVALAKASLDTNGAAVQSAWDSATSPQ